MESQTTSARRGPKPKLDTRENLIRAGSKTFHQAGFGATGIKEIVDAAGVPKGSFYNHFQSKEAFGKAVVDHYFAEGLERLRERFQQASEEPLVRLRQFFEDHTLRFQTNGYTGGCMLGNMSLEIADHSDMIRESLSEHFATWSRLFEDCIQEAQLSGAVRNPLPAAVIAEFLLNSWEGALLRMRAEQSDAPLKKFTEVVFTSVLV